MGSDLDVSRTVVGSDLDVSKDSCGERPGCKYRTVVGSDLDVSIRQLWGATWM